MAEKNNDQLDRVVVRTWPKIVFLYPTLIAALVAGPMTHWKPEQEVFWTSLFLIVLGLNLIVFSFDFPRTTSLTLLFCLVAAVCLMLWLNTQYALLPWLRDQLLRLKPRANYQFFYLVAAGLIFIYMCVYIVTRFDYWVIMRNEVIHHHGILGNVNRYPSPQLKLEKEINDVFELLLLRSGRLLLHPSSERKAVVLENVPNVNKRESEIKELLRALSVHIHSEALDEEA